MFYLRGKYIFFFRGGILFLFRLFLFRELFFNLGLIFFYLGGIFFKHVFTFFFFFLLGGT